MARVVCAVVVTDSSWWARFYVAAIGVAVE
jgi:hypothetical protein